MLKGSVSSIETFGLLDGPGIRTVIFLDGCTLRCKYCHNPETWEVDKFNYTPEELAKKILRFKPYYQNGGGVTFSGGEPLLQAKFLIEVLKILKKENIHVAIDTAGVGTGNYEELLKDADLVIFDVKHITEEGYKDLTGKSMDESLKFLEVANKLEKKFWIRQVIVPGLMDNTEYITGLAEFLKRIKNIEKIEFLPYHKLGSEKYEELGLVNQYKDMESMDIKKTSKLYKRFMEIYKKNA